MWTDGVLVDRAAAGGYDALMVTSTHRRRCSPPRHEERLLDPPVLTPKAILTRLPRIAWLINFLTARLQPGSTAGPERLPHSVDTMFDPTGWIGRGALHPGSLEGQTHRQGHPVGRRCPLAIDLGLDGIVLSNHGGRQLDRAPIPFHLLPGVVPEVGTETEVHLGTGIMNGSDIVASVAMARASRSSHARTSTGSWPAGARGSTAPSRPCRARSVAR